MQHGDERLRSIGAHVGQDAVETLPIAPELSERVVDARRPVHAGYDFSARLAAGVAETIAMDAEGELDDPREPM
jgi:hypothetical protein